MWVLLLAVGCARQVSWEIQPLPSYALPSFDVSVVAGDRGCKRVADALAETLSSRPGVRVRPDAPVRLTVRECDGEIDTNVELESTIPGLVYDTRVREDRQRYSMRGWANAVLEVRNGEGPTARLAGGAERRIRGQWVQQGELEIPRALSLQESVRRDLATDLADQVAPLPETLRRTLYRDPEPGTAKKLHNEAVAAEQAGDLNEALRIANQAYAANPTQDAMIYIEALQEHAQAVGYALVQPDPKPSE
jgi:hypothetical protein